MNSMAHPPATLHHHDIRRLREGLVAFSRGAIPVEQLMEFAARACRSEPGITEEERTVARDLLSAALLTLDSPERPITYDQVREWSRIESLETAAALE